MMKELMLLTTLAMLAPPGAGMAAAQEPPRRAVEFVAGVLMFPDDGTVRENMAGGSMRFYLSPRLAVGPEVTFVQGSRHSHVIATGNLTFDFFGPSGGREPTATPFLVLGGGWYHSREEFPSGGFNSNEGGFTAGGGVRARLAERLYIGAEVRIGWELHVRMNGLVGWRF
jgi:hypothetical protein